MPELTLYLASASPRRQELLRQVGIGFEVLPSTIVERRAPDESPANFVRRMAREKAQHGLRWMTERRLPVRPILGADTEVVLDDEVLGKPQDRGHAARMLRRLSGETHTVLSALCLLLPAGEHSALNENRVQFGALRDSDIESYVATGEADDKAGAYAIQGRAAAFIARLEGSYSGVMGLPLYELRELLQQAGLENS